jgi:hypothetical protein
MPDSARTLDPAPPPRGVRFASAVDPADGCIRGRRVLPAPELVLDGAMRSTSASTIVSVTLHYYGALQSLTQLCSGGVSLALYAQQESYRALPSRPVRPARYANGRLASPSFRRYRRPKGLQAR